MVSQKNATPAKLSHGSAKQLTACGAFVKKNSFRFFIWFLNFPCFFRETETFLLLFHPDVLQPSGYFILRIFYVAAPDGKTLKDG